MKGVQGDGVENRKVLQKTQEGESKEMKAVLRTTQSILNIPQDVSFI